MNNIRNAIAQRDQNQGQQGASMAQFIAQLKPEIERALPKHMDGDRMARLLLTAVRKTPGLARTSPESFAGAVLTAAALGLEPNLAGEAYLVPYKNECQLIIGFAGYVKLFWQHPLAQHIDAQAVYERDDFDYAYGLDPMLRHKPAFGDRGKVVAYYAVASLKTGARTFVVLSPEQVRELRGGRTGASGSIKDPMDWMSRKTAIRQLFRLLPRTSDLNQALASDDVGGSTLRHRQLVSQGEPAPAIEAAPEGVDIETGEVAEGVVVEEGDPPADLWVQEDAEVSAS